MKKIDWDFCDEEEFIDNETYLKDGFIYINGSVLGNNINEYGYIDYDYVNNIYNVISTIDYTNWNITTANWNTDNWNTDNWNTDNWNNINYGNE